MKNSEKLQLITPKQMMQLLQISQTTLWRYCQREDFPKIVKIGPAKVGFRKAEVESWLNAL